MEYRWKHSVNKNCLEKPPKDRMWIFSSIVNGIAGISLLKGSGCPGRRGLPFCAPSFRNFIFFPPHMKSPPSYGRKWPLHPNLRWYSYNLPLPLVLHLVLHDCLIMDDHVSFFSGKISKRTVLLGFTRMGVPRCWGVFLLKRLLQPLSYWFSFKPFLFSLFLSFSYVSIFNRLNMKTIDAFLSIPSILSNKIFHK